MEGKGASSRWENWVLAEGSKGVPSRIYTRDLPYPLPVIAGNGIRVSYLFFCGNGKIPLGEKRL